MIEVNLPKYQFIGILESFWLIAGNFAYGGDIGRFSNDQLMNMIGWDKTMGEFDQLIKILVKNKWLSTHEFPEVRLVINDWHIHANTGSYPKKIITKIKKNGGIKDGKTTIWSLDYEHLNKPPKEEEPKNNVKELPVDKPQKRERPKPKSNGKDPSSKMATIQPKKTESEIDELIEKDKEQIFFIEETKRAMENTSNPQKLLQNIKILQNQFHENKYVIFEALQRYSAFSNKANSGTINNICNEIAQEVIMSEQKATFYKQKMTTMINKSGKILQEARKSTQFDNEIKDRIEVIKAMKQDHESFDEYIEHREDDISIHNMKDVFIKEQNPFWKEYSELIQL